MKKNEVYVFKGSNKANESRVTRSAPKAPTTKSAKAKSPKPALNTTFEKVRKKIMISFDYKILITIYKIKQSSKLSTEIEKSSERVKGKIKIYPFLTKLARNCAKYGYRH